MNLPLNNFSNKKNKVEQKQVEAKIHSIAFIDATVPDYQTLIAGINPEVEIVLLDSTHDGVEQISSVEANRSELTSVHIISHGSSGAAQLGAAQLSLNSLDKYSSQLQQWKSALTPGADILLYGCDVAAGDIGKAFVRRLLEITDVDIAASDDLTGSALLGGDWELEVKTGEIDSSIAFTLEVTKKYRAILPSFAPKADYGTGTNPRFVSIGDINGDGKPDLAVANFGSNTVSVLLNNGNGTFAPKTDYTTGSNPPSVSIGDINSDGKPDLAVANFSSNNVSVLLNTTPKVTIAASGAPSEAGINGTFTIFLDQPAPASGVTVNFNTTGSTAAVTTNYNLTAGNNITNPSVMGVQQMTV